MTPRQFLGVVEMRTKVASLATLASIPLYSRMLRQGLSHATKSASMRRIIGAFSLWSLGYAAGLVIG